MTRQKKKRNKPYRGTDARHAPPTVIKMEAANRSHIGQWWHEKKRFAKPILIAAAVLFILSWLIFELIRFIIG